MPFTHIMPSCWPQVTFINILFSTIYSKPHYWKKFNFKKNLFNIFLGHSAIYEHYRSDCKWLSIPPGLKTYYSQDLFGSSSLPAKLYVVFFDQDRLNGHYEKSIQKYERPSGLKYCSIELDGRPVGDYGSFVNDYDAGLLNFQYLQIFHQTQSYYKPGANVPNISLDSFKERHFILCYDLTASGYCTENMFPLIKTGSLRLHMEFSTAQTKSLSCLVLSTSPATLTIDNNRMVALSFRT